MKTIIVTPAGRQRYLKVLYKHLLVQKNDFFEWHLWLNTTNQEDINFCKKLEKENSWIKTFDLTEGFNGNLSICSFFKNATDSDTVYIRFDDDVIFLEDDFIKNFTQERIKNKDPYFIFPIIINNGNMAYHLQKNGKVWFPINISYTEDCLNELWKDHNLAEKMHNDFILDIKNGYIKKYHIDDIVINNFYRHSINCISWFGETMKDIVEKNDINVYRDEEFFLSVLHPKNNNNPNMIIGSVVCSHFSFHVQREHLDRTNILLEYEKISNNISTDYIFNKLKQDIVKESKNSIEDSKLSSILNTFRSKLNFLEL